MGWGEILDSREDWLWKERDSRCMVCFGNEWYTHMAKIGVNGSVEHDVGKWDVLVQVQMWVNLENSGLCSVIHKSQRWFSSRWNENNIRKGFQCSDHCVFQEDGEGWQEGIGGDEGGRRWGRTCRAPNGRGEVSTTFPGVSNLNDSFSGMQLEDQTFEERGVLFYCLGFYLLILER